MFCTNCGYQLTREIQFCPQCGKPIAAIPDLSQPFEENQNSQFIHTDQKIKYTKYGIGFAIGILLIILMEFTNIGNYAPFRTLFIMAVYSFCIVITYQFPPKKAVLFPVVCILISLCYCYYLIYILGEPFYFAKNIIPFKISRYIFVLLVFCFCLIFRKKSIKKEKTFRYFVVTSISAIFLYIVYFGLQEIISTYSGSIDQETILSIIFSNLIAGIPIPVFSFLFYFIYRKELKIV